MGERIPAFSTKTSRDGSKYPWDDWSDGSIWRVERGKDFPVSIESISKTIYMKARALGGTARVHIVSETVIEFRMDVPE